MVKALTAPLQRGGTKGTAVHVKVTFRRFDDAFIGIAVRCQKHGVLRMLHDAPQLVDALQPWQLDLLLSGRVHVTVRAARGLVVQGALPLMSKKTCVCM